MQDTLLERQDKQKSIQEELVETTMYRVINLPTDNDEKKKEE